MKEITFRACCLFGRGDDGDTYIDVDLTDEEVDRLIKYADGDCPDDFDTCEELKDIYNKVYEIAVEQITEELREGDMLDEEDLNDSEWRADKRYCCVVEFPEDIEDMLDEDNDE